MASEATTSVRAGAARSSFIARAVPITSSATFTAAIFTILFDSPNTASSGAAAPAVTVTGSVKSG